MPEFLRKKRAVFWKYPLFPRDPPNEFMFFRSQFLGISSLIKISKKQNLGLPGHGGYSREKNWSRILKFMTFFCQFHWVSPVKIEKWQKSRQIRHDPPYFPCKIGGFFKKLIFWKITYFITFFTLPYKLQLPFIICIKTALFSEFEIHSLGLSRGFCTPKNHENNTIIINFYEKIDF